MNSGMAHKCCSIKCISWTAILVGAIVGTGLGLLFNLFSVAIGLTAFASSTTGVTAFAVGGFIGFAIGAMISSFVGGYTAGYLAHPHCPKRNSGALYGFTTWVVTLLVIISVSASLGHFMFDYGRLLTNNNPQMTHPMLPPNPDIPAPTPDQMTKMAFAIFALFFLAAVSGSFGGHFGMVCRPEDCGKDGNSTNNINNNLNRL